MLKLYWYRVVYRTKGSKDNKTYVINMQAHNLKQVKNELAFRDKVIVSYKRDK